MVRLVFRPYTQVWRSICTSESLRASTRVSSGFTLLRHSSPSFGSHPTCFTAVSSVKTFLPGHAALIRDRILISFLAHAGLPPKYSHVRWTPWSVFQDGSLTAITPDRVSPLLSHWKNSRSHLIHGLSHQQNHALLLPGCKRFPFSNFTYCFTLFSKCFSSFPHGTCSLSVSRQYLALDVIYHPI